MKKLRLLCPILLSLVCMSCIGIDTVINFDPDGGGDILMKYRISNMIADLGQSDDSDILPFPVNERDFKESAAKIRGLTFRSYNREESADDIIITAGFSFDDTDALCALINSGNSSSLEITKKGDRTYFKQILFNGAEGKISKDTLDIVRGLFSSYSVSTELDLPSEALTLSGGKADRKKCSVVYSIDEIFSSEGPVVWEVVW